MHFRTPTRSATLVTATLAALCVLAGCARPGATSTPPAPGGPTPPAAARLGPAAGTAGFATATPAATATATPVAGSTFSAPLPALDAGEVALGSAMPGLFGAADLHPTIDGDVISVWSQRSCSGLLDVLRAGQWTIRLVHQPTRKGQRSWVAVMRQGGARGLLVLNGGSGGCSGRITHDRAVSVTASGAVQAEGDGRYLSFLCLAQWDDTNSDTGSDTGTDSDELVPSQEFLFGTYTVDGQAFLLEGELPTKTGSYHLTPAEFAALADDDQDSDEPSVSVALLPADQDPLTVLISALGMMLYPLDLSAEQGDQAGSAFGQLLSSYPTYASGRKAQETITITSTSPLSGTVTATGLVNQQHRSNPTLDFSAPFTCDR